jgi:glycosyltransferase involved in cell wall biosynthesis
MRKIRLLMFIGNLDIGGAEQQFMLLVNSLPRDFFDIGICVCEEGNGGLYSKIPSDTHYYSLKKKSRFSFISQIQRYHKVVKEFNPDLVYTRMGYVNLFAVLEKFIYRSKWPIIANEEHDHTQEIKNFYSKVIILLQCWSYRHATKVIVPSNGVKRDISINYKLRANNIDVIYNAVYIAFVRDQSLVMIPFENENIFNKPVISAFGRMIYRKGFDDLLKAFKIVSKKIDCNLILIGNGEELSNLEKLSETLGISKNVYFLGYQDNPYKFLARSTVFLFSSLWEGFGNVLIEAMACGLPIISTDCKHGPSEIIRNDIEGIIIPVRDYNSMAQKILDTLTETTILVKLRNGSLNRANDFCIEHMVSKYCTTFYSVYSGKLADKNNCCSGD